MDDAVFPRTSTTRALLQIHFCVLLWGFTAVLGRLMTLSSLRLVYWRMLLSALALLCVPRFWRGVLRMHRRSLARYAGTGVVVCLHWLWFYGSVKLANASVAASCLALTPVFTAVLEPRLLGRQLNMQELFLGLLALPGMILLAGGTPESMHQGIIAGVLAAVVGALFVVLNARYIGDSDPLSVTGVEMAAGALLLALVGWLWPSERILAAPPMHDVRWLLVLALGCTLLPLALWLVTLRHLSAFATTLISSLEPLYAIVLAALLLGEQQHLTMRFYAGAVFLVLVVSAHPLLNWLRHTRMKQRSAE